MHKVIPLAAILLASSPAAAEEVHRHVSAAPNGAAPVSEGSFESLMAQAMNRMHAQMAAVPKTGTPDRDFVTFMIPHHQGAIDMARAVLLATNDPRIRNLAQSIITEQTYEIELMKTLLMQNMSVTSSPQENRK